MYKFTNNDDIIDGLENEISVDVLYNDFSKAFDKVDLIILTYQICDMGITGKCGE